MGFLRGRLHARAQELLRDQAGHQQRSRHGELRRGVLRQRARLQPLQDQGAPALVHRDRKLDRNRIVGPQAPAETRSLFTATAAGAKPQDLTEYHYLFDGSVPHGLGYYWKSHYLRDLTPEAIDAFVERGWAAESRLSYTIMFHMGGAVRHVHADATAFEDRTAEFSPNINAVWEDLDAPQDIDWTRDLFSALKPASTGKAYVNFMSSDEQARVSQAYGEVKLARLVALKDRLDPDNVFRLNQNIPPSGGVGQQSILSRR